MFPMGAAAKAAINLLSRHADHRPAETSFQQALQESLGARILAARDANGDGVLSANEFPGDAALFSAWDADQDGKLSSAELDAGARLSRQWQLLDSDRDGSLTQHEIGATHEVFRAMDSDHDGVVSRREFHRAYRGGGVA
jgi:hypothetical protein